MTNIRISELPTATTLVGTELVPVVQGGVTKHTTISSIASGSSVADFTSGTIDGVTIGGVVPAAGTFTSLTFTTSPTLIAGTGASLIGYNEGDVGAIDNTVEARLRQRVSVKDFGATGDGVTDDTTAMQAAHNSGKVIYYPKGDYLFTGVLTIADGGIVGDGPGQTRLINEDTTNANLINCTGPIATFLAPTFENFQVIATGVKAGGAGLFLNFASVVNFVQIINVMSYNAPICFRLKNVELGGMTGCTALGYSDAGVYFENTQPLGEGDFSIQGCMFNTGIVTGQPKAVRQISGAGLRFVNNKVLGGYGGFIVEQTAANAGGPLIVTGNSFEGITTYGIGLFSNSGASPFDYVNITGNEVTQQGTAGAAIAADNTGKFIRMVISGNNIMFGSGSSSGISLADTDEFTISGNTIGCFATSSSFGIVIAAACSNGRISGNRVFSNNTINNAASSTVIEDYLPYISTGSGSVSTTVAFGTLFTGNVTVSFGHTYLTPPLVNMTVDTGATAFCAQLIAVTTTAVAFQIFATTNASVNYTWRAVGA